MQQYCGCYGLLLRYMPKNVLFVTYSRSISQPHTRLTEMALGRQVDIAVLQFTASYEADRHGFKSCLRNFIFQFTASHEADPFLAVYTALHLPFNSQPHTRLTAIDFERSGRGIGFQFTASYEADRQYRRRGRTACVFQFTTSYEADLWKTCCPTGKRDISIHSLIRG